MYLCWPALTYARVCYPEKLHIWIVYMYYPRSSLNAVYSSIQCPMSIYGYDILCRIHIHEHVTIECPYMDMIWTWPTQVPANQRPGFESRDMITWSLHDLSRGESGLPISQWLKCWPPLVNYFLHMICHAMTSSKNTKNEVEMLTLYYLPQLPFWVPQLQSENLNSIAIIYVILALGFVRYFFGKNTLSALRSFVRKKNAVKCVCLSFPRFEETNEKTFMTGKN